jgi:hypothetical protein
MIFLANRANLDRRTLLNRIHNRFQTQVTDENSPITQVQYQTSAGNKVGVRATVTTETFLTTEYPVDEAEVQVSFDFPKSHSYDFYVIQWIDADRNLMVGWHQDGTHPDLGECHFQIDYGGETVQQSTADFLDHHPINVLDRRLNDLAGVLDVLTWNDDIPMVPSEAIR